MLYYDHMFIIGQLGARGGAAADAGRGRGGL